MNLEPNLTSFGCNIEGHREEKLIFDQVFRRIMIGSSKRKTFNQPQQYPHI